MLAFLLTALGRPFAGAATGFRLSAWQTWLFTGLRGGGVLDLLDLAWRPWRDAGTELQPDRRAGVLPFFRQGLNGHLLNPKAYLFYAAILPQFLQPGLGLHRQIATSTRLPQ